VMRQYPAELRAGAVIGMRYDATEFVQGATEVPAYGTAVRLGAVYSWHQKAAMMLGLQFAR